MEWPNAIRILGQSFFIGEISGILLSSDAGGGWIVEVMIVYGFQAFERKHSYKRHPWKNLWLTDQLYCLLNNDSFECNMLAGVDLAVILDNFESKSWLTRKHILKLILCSIKVMVGTELLSLCPCPVFYQANSSAISYVGKNNFFLVHSQVTQCVRLLGSLPKTPAPLWRGAIWSALLGLCCQQSLICWCWQTCLTSTSFSCSSNW